MSGEITCPVCKGFGLIETWCVDNDYYRTCPKCLGQASVKNGSHKQSERKMKWINASERKPELKDADFYRCVHIRRELSPSVYCFNLRHFENVEDHLEWLEGANEPVDTESSGKE